MTIPADTIKAALADIQEPNLGGNLIAAGVVGAIRDEEIELVFPYPARGVFAGLKEEIGVKLRAAGLSAIPAVRMTVSIAARTVQGGVERMSGVKNVIAVASAKGGVGKSATAVNVALALALEGARVGLMDADIYGPSAPVMLGVDARPNALEGGGIAPVMAHGLQTMSAGFLVGDDQPMVWRGPMATGALTQLLRETKWDNLDYLILDMPPGTGDIALTIAQRIPVTGAIVVTTPQDLALADAQKGLRMFEKVSIPVLGIAENMSVYQCPNCGHRAAIFGEGGAKKMCERYGAELLGEIPLDISVRECADAGRPTLSADPDGAIAAIYRKIAVRAAVKIAEKSRDFSAAFPKIVVSDT